ncbi:NAD(P)/FAD-dependent oxidoreductase [Halococcus hamelinensis]|uniref:Thioredoxin reductase-like protein n=1 Tax=Halococcus hamelinensis 100A6 TaxID=1132509 RepID=M0MC50_9EURY|nr:NAD(P)/FAD-dependent oxidoreductase [Halococcus hamelinensis]EMA42239.1 thioredoxin reductase-like protein [Halococcus hamelinensis 100A6]
MRPDEVRKYESLDVVVVGAGAAGVGIGAVLADLDLDSYAILERDEVGASFERWPEEMRFITPSFPGNNFGCRDLNAVTIDTSPAFALDREHPSGEEYAEYLRAVAEFHDLPVRTGVAVESIQRSGTDVETPGEHTDGFVLHTSTGVIRSQFVVWAAGQFGAPNDDPFPGASHCVHNSRVDSWRTFASECTDDPVVVVGGYESGIDAALALADLGTEVLVVDETGPWQFRGPDPSEVLSPYTSQRLQTASENDAPIALEDGIRVERVDVEEGTFVVRGTDGAAYATRNSPVLATGFEGTFGPADKFFEKEDHRPRLTDRDESTIASGLFLVGPQVAHNGQDFCFIYKFRQRFAVVADEIAARLEIDRAPLEEYRDEGMFLQDLSCCEPDICDC